VQAQTDKGDLPWELAQREGHEHVFEVFVEVLGEPNPSGLGD
jgi:hypothetical protein